VTELLTNHLDEETNMDIPLVLGALAVVSGVIVLWYSIAGSRGGAATLDLGRLEEHRYDLHAAGLQQGVGPRAIQPLVGRVGRLARRYTPHGRYEALEQRLLLAGTPRGWTAERVLAVKVLAGATGIGLGILYIAGSPSVATVAAAVLLAVIGFFGPDIVLRRKAAQRQTEIRRSLADTIDQMVIAVKAGLGLDAAIARVARSTDGPLADELSRAVQDTRAGVPRAAALQALAARTEVPELRHVIVALVQAERLGVPVAQTLQVQAGELRVRRRQYAEEQAQKLPVKILFPMVVCIMPSLFIVILGPAAINIMESL
jgi:tight adherence protein C